MEEHAEYTKRERTSAACCVPVAGPSPALAGVGLPWEAEPAQRGFLCAASAKTPGRAVALFSLLLGRNQVSHPPHSPRALSVCLFCLPTESALLSGHAGPSACGSGHCLWLSVSRGKPLHPPVSPSDLARPPPLCAHPCVSPGPDSPLRSRIVGLAPELPGSSSSIIFVRGTESPRLPQPQSKEGLVKSSCPGRSLRPP